MTNSSMGAPASGREQRKLRNLLLDKKFQLKYAGYLMGIATLVGATLGVTLWMTSNRLVEQSQRSAKQGEEIVRLGQEVLSESRKVSAVVRMNIVKDPVYQDDPDLLAAFNHEADKQEEKLDRQRDQLTQRHSELMEHSVELERFYRLLLVTLVGGLIFFVLVIGAAGIFVTHKVAGPIFKMKKHLKQVTKGELEVPWGLRKGDELVDFFDAFREMVASLRTTRETQIERLDSVLGSLDGKVEANELEPLHRIKADLKKGL